MRIDGYSKYQGLKKVMRLSSSIKGKKVGEEGIPNDDP